MNRPFRARHARNLQADFQEGWGVNPRHTLSRGQALRIPGMTKGLTSLIGSLAQQTRAVRVRLSG